MKSNAIIDLIPKKKKKTLVQVKIDDDLYKSVKDIMKSKNMTWTQLITACLKFFVDDLELKKK